MSEVSEPELFTQSLCLSAVFIFNTTIKSQTILNCHMYLTHNPVELAPTEECYTARRQQTNTFLLSYADSHTGNFLHAQCRMQEIG